MSQISPELYKKIHAAMPIPCIDAVICHENKVLLCIRTNKPAQGLWWFPGGRVLKGELLIDAVKRKVQEETGLEASDIKMLGTEETLFPDGPFGEPTHTINVVFRVNLSIPQDATIADGQHVKMCWFTDLPKDLHPYIQKYAERALEENNSDLP